MKVVFLAIQQASKKWTMPIRAWKPELNRFIIEFGDRLDGYLQWGVQLHRFIYRLGRSHFPLVRERHSRQFASV